MRVNPFPIEEKPHIVGELARRLQRRESD